jgi:hypothetical protein
MGASIKEKQDQKTKKANSGMHGTSQYASREDDIPTI